MVLQVTLAAALVASSCVAARRWGERIAGLTSAFPAVAGPFLLLVADEHGDRAAATAANGTLAGLLVFSGFVVAYAQAARRSGWLTSLAAGWSAAVLLGAFVDLLAPSAPLGVLLAFASLTLAWRLMPSGGVTGQRIVGNAEMLCLAALAASLVFMLAHAVEALGPQLGGTLAGLPAIATVLAVNTHRRRGADASTTLMRGMLGGMAGFVVFCEIVSVMAISGGTAATFSVAAFAALSVQVAAAYLVRRPLLSTGRRLSPTSRRFEAGTEHRGRCRGFRRASYAERSSCGTQVTARSGQSSGPAVTVKSPPRGCCAQRLSLAPWAPSSSPSEDLAATAAQSGQKARPRAISSANSIVVSDSSSSRSRTATRYSLERSTTRPIATCPVLAIASRSNR